MKVQASVPTIHQLTSISRLCGGWQRQADGSFLFEEEFDSHVEAEAFLYERLSAISDHLDEEELSEKKREIRRGYLSYDAAVLSIQKDEAYV